MSGSHVDPHPLPAFQKENAEFYPNSVRIIICNSTPSAIESSFVRESAAGELGQNNWMVDYNFVFAGIHLSAYKSNVFIILTTTERERKIIKKKKQ